MNVRIKWEEDDFSNFNIKLMSGQHFHNINKDYQTLYKNFCLLSYMTKICRIKILQYYESILGYNRGVYKFRFERLKNMQKKQFIQQSGFLFQLQKAKFSTSQKKLKIKYIFLEESVFNSKFYYIETELKKSKIKLEKIICDKFDAFKSQTFIQEYLSSLSDDIRRQMEESIKRKIYEDLFISLDLKYENCLQKLHEVTEEELLNEKIIQRGLIQVQFFTEVKNNHEVIHIKIFDRDKCLKKKFELNQKVMNTNRISEIIQLKDGQLQYFYQQPENIRTKIIKQKHFGLALQGGGIKGISYVGAFRAFVNYYSTNKDPEDINITSMIGSSAGALVGVGIAMKLTPEEIQYLIIKYLSNIPAKDKSSNIYDQKEEQKIYAMLKDFINSYGLINETLVDIVEEGLTSDKISEALIKKLNDLNPSVKELFTQKNFEGKEKLSLNGLFKANLMKGNQLRQMARQGICMFLKRYYFKKYCIDLSKSKTLREYSERITLKKLYELTGIQFTCTSVDIDDYILRFFNHKTTPDLPVLESVHISGSFPIVFESQKWKKEWGKYYIHYANTRRQLDLLKNETRDGKIQTGHQLVDGGMLANFPIKYLDNEKMRPMYFSHKRITKQDDPENYTVLYGFGLEQVNDDTEQTQKQSSIVGIMSSILEFFFPNPEEMEANFQAMIVKEVLYKGKSFFNPIGQMNAAKLLTKVFLNGGYRAIKKQNTTIDLKDPENPVQKLLQQPFIKFLLKLLQTFVKSKDNLNRECFADDSHTVGINLKNYDVGQEETDELIRSQIKKIKEQLKKLVPQISSEDEKKHNFQEFIFENPQMKDKVIENLKFLRQSTIMMNSGDIPLKQNSLVQVIDAYKMIIEPYFCERGKNKEDAFINKNRFNILHSYLININIMKNSKIFYFSGLNSDCKFLQQAIQATISYFEDVFQGKQCSLHCKTSHNICEKTFMQKALSSMYKSQTDLFKKLIKDIDYDEKTKNLKNAHQIINIQKCSLVNNIESIKRFFRAVSKVRLHKIRCSYQCFQNRNHIKQYFQTKLLNRKDEDGVHIIAQSAPLSEYYFHEFVTRSKEAIGDFNQRNQCLGLTSKIKNPLQITSMTASNFNAVAMFLHASDLSSDRVCYEISSIRSLIEVNRKSQEIIQKKDWAAFNMNSMKQLQKKFENNKKQIFETNHPKLRKVESEKDLKRFQQKLKLKVEEQYNNLQIQLESSLNYFIDTIYELNEAELVQKKVKQLEDKLNLISKFESENDIMTKGGSQYMFEILIQKYCDTVKCLLCSTPYMIQNLKYTVSANDRKQIWKGLIVGQALTTCKVKDYICDILEKDLNLRKDTTLAEFYESSKQKILINFSTIESNSKCITFLNYKTRPEMPVWAAVLSSMSLPLFFKPIVERNQWSYVKEKQSQSRLLNRLFGQRSSQQKQYQSADLLTKLPLQLVTNDKMRKAMNIDKKQIFFILNFNIEEPQESIKIVDKIQTQALTPWDILKIIGFIGKNYFKKSNQLTSNKIIPAISERIKVLDLYVNSFDNLTKNTYKQELVILPIKIGTLDFWKIADKNMELSDIAVDIVRQSELVSYEKFENSEKLKGKNQKQDKYIYFRVEQKVKNKKIMANRFVLKFLSMHNKCKGLEQKYIIEIKKEDEQGFTEVKNQSYQVQLFAKDRLIMQVTSPFFKYTLENQRQKVTQTQVKSYLHKMVLPIYNNDLKKNGLTFKLCFNKFHSQQQFLPMQFPKVKTSILLESIIPEANKKNSCLNCYGVMLRSPSEMEKDGTCSLCYKQTSLIMICQNKDCSYRFCVKCGFNGQTNDKHILVCTLGHQIIRNDKRMLDYCEDEEQRNLYLAKVGFKFSSCDLCGHYPKQLYTDPICNVDICEACRIKMIRLH